MSIKFMCFLFNHYVYTVNTVYLFVGVLPRIITSIYNTDATETSLFHCKFRYYCSTICTTISMTCFCLATIDQYCATCSRPRFQQWCNIKLARRLIIIFSIIWILHATPYLFLFDHDVSPTTGRVMCIMTNTIYIQYRTYIIVLGLYGCLPVCIVMIFGLMAFHNVRQLAHYTVPLVRRELDKQLTVMVLTQVLIDIIVIIPYVIINTIQSSIMLDRNSATMAQIQSVSNILFTIYCLYFASPFYIYICASERFRRQLIYVLFKIHLNRCKRPPKLVNNQILPQS